MIEAGFITPAQLQDACRHQGIAGGKAALVTGALQTAIFNSANFSIIATDEKGVIRLFNVGAERMLGYVAADVVNKITPAEISDPQEAITRAKGLSFEFGTPIAPGLDALVFKASRGIEDIYELTYIRKDGSRFPAVVSVTALRDAQGGIIGYLLIGTDNTARKQVEAEQKKLDQCLRDQQFYTRSLIESNIDAIMTTDSQGIITDVNQQMGALTGCTRDELIGAPFRNYFTDPERAEASIKQVLTEGKVTNYELTARARDGKETVVSYNAIILYDRDRRLQGVFAAARDVTEFKRFERTLQESNDQLRKLEELRDNLVHMVVHDMRTPLTAIYGFLQALEMFEGESLSDRGREFVQTALASTEHLVEMVSSLLDVSQMEAGEMKLNLIQCELLTIAREALAKVEPLRGDRQLMLSGADEPVTVMADAEIIARVFQNLLGNALKFTPDDGRVTVSVEPSADAVRVLVQDTGPGISPEYRERIFEKFGQVENHANKQRYSTGIGLTFCKLAVETHGGQVGVDSEEGRGSTFWFTLPSQRGQGRTRLAFPVRPLLGDPGADPAHPHPRPVLPAAGRAVPPRQRLHSRRLSRKGRLGAGPAGRSALAHAGLSVRARRRRLCHPRLPARGPRPGSSRTHSAQVQCRPALARLPTTARATGPTPPLRRES